MLNQLLRDARLRPAVILGLALLAVLAYTPAQFLPLISDDYEQISVSRRYGAIDNWDDLLGDPLYRCRAVSIVLTWWIEKFVGFWPPAFTTFSLFHHILNTLSVAALGLWSRIGWRISIPAAAFFAVAEGHQEAVIWYAALPELNVFFFTMVGFLCWVLWLERDDAKLYAASLIAFVFAIFSKESGVAVVGLQALAIFLVRPRQIRSWAGLLPFLGISALYFVWGYAARSTHLHYNDGTFSLTAPFLLTIVNSLARMFWFWGFLACGVLLALCHRKGLKFVVISVAFAAAALLPYSFLAYMPRVPSRHTYMAGVAVALIVGYALTTLAARLDRRWMTAIVAAILIHNCGYLWFYKQGQYAKRAAPTAELIQLLKTTDGPIIVDCFPFALTVAEQAATIAAGTSKDRLIFRQKGCEDWRYTPVSDDEAATRHRGQ